MRIKKIAAISTCFILATAATALVGCSKNTDRNSSAQQYIQTALHTMNKANQGYATKANSENKTISYQQYRQDTLDSAIEPLQNAISSGTTSQTAVAKALLAQINSSKSRFFYRHANDQYAKWLASTGNIVSQAISIDSANDRALILKVDNSDGIKALQSYIKQLQAKAKSIKKQIENEQSKVKTQKEKVNDLQKQASKLMAQSQDVHQKGFVLTGDKQFDLYNKAAKLQAQAADISIEAQRHKVKKQTHERKLTYLKIKQKSIADGIDNSKKRIKQFSTQQKDLTKSKLQAKKETKEAATKLIKDFKKLSQDYQNKVIKTYEKASGFAAKSVSLLESAQGQFGVSKKEQINTKLLSSYLNQTNILLNQASAIKGFSDLIELISVDKNNHLNLSSAQEQLKESLNKLKSKQKELLGQAQKAIEQGEKIVSNLANKRGDIAKIAKSQQKLLASYKKLASEVAGDE